MKRSINGLIVGLAGVALAACGGSGGGGGGGSSSDLLTFAELAAIETKLDNDVVGHDALAPADLPDSGTANYQGTISFTPRAAMSDSLKLRGDLDVRVDFTIGGGDINGSASNFVDSDQTQYTGQFALDLGSIDITADPAMDFTFDAELDGTISNASGVSYTADSSGGSGPNNAFISGEFLAPSGTTSDTHIRGIVSGNLIRNGTSVSVEGDTPDTNGSFIAARQ